METGLAITASYEVGHTLDLTHFQIASFLSPGSKIHTLAWDK